MTPTPRANRLQHEKSPYLLQHARNPVDWYPWSDEAFAAARAAGKPVFLSIGYSTCYWCHVMEKESFESESIAALLNESFVAIKVDREERPDIDALYMAAVQAMTGQGGWPMSVFLTPDGEPFWCGTYFPPVDGHGRAGFATILRALASAWRERRDDVVRAGRQLAEAIRNASRSQAAPAPLPPDVVARAADQLAHSFDRTNGGFGGAPKFPRAHALSLLLRHWERTADEQSLAIVEATLAAMARGGIHDHLGGGLHRYAVDERWMIPHFEKMLYDQALLARAATEAYLATGRVAHAAVARDTLDYVLRDMRDPDGAFYSAEDAGEVGREGEFYVWRPEDLIAWLSEADVALASARWGVTGSGNFEDGTTVLHEAQSIEDVAAAHGMTPDAARARLETIRGQLLAARARRTRPHRDDKVLADWNGLMIGALAFAGAHLDDARYVDAATDAARTILRRMRGPDGLLHRFRDGEAAIPAFLDDVACLASGLLDVFDATGDPSWLRAAIDLADEMIASFADAENGGFHHTGPRHDRLIARVRDAYDGAVPSGQSMAALVCTRLAHLTAERRFHEHAERTFASFAGSVTDMPSAFTAFLCAWDLWSGPVDEVVIAATEDAAATAAAMTTARAALHSRRIVVRRPTGPAVADVEELVPFTRGRAALGGRVTAYVCRDSVCSRPLVDPEELERELRGR